MQSIQPLVSEIEEAEIAASRLIPVTLHLGDDDEPRAPTTPPFTEAQMLLRIHLVADAKERLMEGSLVDPGRWGGNTATGDARVCLGLWKSSYVHSRKPQPPQLQELCPAVTPTTSARPPPQATDVKVAPTPP